MNVLGSLHKLIILSVLVTTPAWAENWFIADGTEPPGAPAVKVFGLIQPTYQQDYSDKVFGLAGPESGNEGKYPYVGLIAPGYKSLSSFYLFRVRLGARGAVDDMTNYEVVGEYGTNALTTQPGQSYNTELAEGSITFNQIPAARIRVGLFKTPGEEEGLRTAIDYVNFTNVTSRFINYQPVEPMPGATLAYGQPGQTSSGVRSFRDTGVQVFDAFTHGNTESSYAVMVGNGSALNQTDDNNGKAVYGRLQWSYLFAPSSGYPVPDREDCTVFIWHQDGTQQFGTSDYRTVREGLGVSALREPYHLTAEYMRGEGMILATPLFFSDPIPVFPGINNTGNGWYVDAGMFVTRRVMLEARYDVLDLLPNLAPMEQRFNTSTLGLLYYFSKSARVAFNYEFREFKSPGVTPADGSLYTNVTKVADAVGNRVAIQVTLKFP
ncbi:MAG: hypothetical protein ACYC9J_06665 [Sulfuricaulis sp.]